MQALCLTSLRQLPVAAFVAPAKALVDALGDDAEWPLVADSTSSMDLPA
jgi:hypothetical protein